MSLGYGTDSEEDDYSGSDYDGDSDDDNDKKKVKSEINRSSRPSSPSPRKSKYHDNDPMESIKSALSQTELSKLSHFCIKMKVSEIRRILSTAGLKSFGGSNLSNFRKEKLCEYIAQAAGETSEMSLKQATDIEKNVDRCERYSKEELVDFIRQKGWLVPGKKRRSKPELCRYIREKLGKKVKDYTDKELLEMAQSEDKRLTIGLMLQIAKERGWITAARTKGSLSKFFVEKLSE